MAAKTNAVLTGAGLAAVIMAGGVAWQNAQATHEQAERRATLERKNPAVQAEIQQAEMRLATAERERAEFQATLERLKPPAVAVAPPGPAEAKPPAPTTKAEAEKAVSRAMNAALRDLEKTANDPQWQNLQLAASRAKFIANYAPLFRALALSAAQREQFLAVALRREEQFMDLGALVQAGKISLQDPTSGKVWRQVDVDFETGARAALGEAGYRQAQEYERTQPMRTLASTMAGEALIAGVPFTAQQAEQMVQVLAEASPHYRKGEKAFPGGLDWEAIDARAAEILGAEQATWLKTRFVARFGTRFESSMSRVYETDPVAKSPAAKMPGR